MYRDYLVYLLSLLLTPLFAVLVLVVQTPMADQIHESGHSRDAVIAADELNMELLDQTGGITLAVAVQNDYAYIGEGSRLLIVNISDPAAPTLAGKTMPLPERAHAIAVQGDQAFLALGDTGLRIIDVSDPTNPREVGQWQESGAAYQLAVAGDFVYLIAGGLHILDISDPTVPQEVGFYQVAANDVTVEDGYAYLAVSDGLQILDLAEPSNPIPVGHLRVVGNGNHVSVAGDHAYMTVHNYWCDYFDCYEFNELIVVNVIDRANPTRSASLEMGMSTRDLASDGRLVYATASDDVQVVDVSNPNSPVGLSDAITPGWAWQVAVAGAYLYVADFHGGLRIIGLANPSVPAEVGSYDTAFSPSGVALSGSHAYVTAGYEGLQIIEIAALTDHRIVGALDMPGYVAGLAVTEGMAYVADMDYGLRIISVSNPAAPAEIGSIATPSGSNDVEVLEGYAYVASRSGGLRVIDVHDPSAPVEVGYLETPGWAEGLTVAGTRAYFADTWGGLHIVDIANPHNPKEIGYLDTPGVVEGLAVAGKYVYLAEGSHGLRIVDIGDPRMPREVGNHGTPGWPVAVAVNEDLVYVADLSGGIRVFDVSDPTSPVEVGFYVHGNRSTNDVTVVDDSVFAIDQGLGLLVLGHYGPHTISGRVSLDDGSPLASVWLSAGPRHTVSNSEGEYRLTRLQPGSYAVIAAQAGYTFTPAVSQVTVPPDSAQIDFIASAWADVWSVWLPTVNVP